MRHLFVCLPWGSWLPGRRDCIGGYYRGYLADARSLDYSSYYGEAFKGHMKVVGSLFLKLGVTRIPLRIFL